MIALTGVGMRFKHDHKNREMPGRGGLWTRMKDKVLVGAFVAALGCACDKPAGIEAPDGGNRTDASLDAGRLDATVDGGVYNGPAEPCTWKEHLIGDTLDRRNCDRQGHTGPEGASQSYPLGGPDTSDETNPFTDGKGGSIGPSETFLFRLGSQDATILQDSEIYDAFVGMDYSATQAIFVRGSSRFDADAGEVAGKADFIAYALTFEGPDGDELGIPVCSSDIVELDDFASCKQTCTGYSLASEAHLMEFEILGERWLLTNLSPPSGEIASEEELISGGSIRFGKEEVADFLTTGGSIY